MVFDPEIIRRFDVNGPRYTSYPTADRFVDSFGTEAAGHSLSMRAQAQVSTEPARATGVRVAVAERGRGWWRKVLPRSLWRGLWCRG